MKSRVLGTPGLLALAGGLTGGFLGGAMSRSRCSVALGAALGALWGAVGGYMRNAALRQRQADQLDFAEMTTFLCQQLGEEITAYLSGLDETETVRDWARGHVHPDPEEMARVQVAYGATRCLVPACGDEMTRTWFFGMNRLLDDTAPVNVLRHSDRERWSGVLLAAQQFAEI